MGVDDHRRRAAGVGAVRFSVLTTSDSRTVETDESGGWARDRLAGEGHTPVAHRVIGNESDAIRSAIHALAGEADFVLVTGGTGISRRDVTIAAATTLFDRAVPGFGELFRALSYQEIGPAALLSGAALGVVRGTLVACVPGSPGAVRLALDRLIVPELRHWVAELRK